MLHITETAQHRKGKLARQTGIKPPHESPEFLALWRRATHYLMCQLSLGLAQELAR